jgi:hypothetical protein
VQRTMATIRTKTGLDVSSAPPRWSVTLAEAQEEQPVSCPGRAELGELSAVRFLSACLG